MRRALAVAIVVASACTALKLSTTSQQTVVVSNDPYIFNGAGSQTFTVSPAGSADDDTISSISMTCSSQWSLNLGLDSQTVPGARVCGGSIVASGAETGDAVPCPVNYVFGVSFAGTAPGTSTCIVYVATMPTGGGSGSGVYQLDLTGIGPAPAGITVTPATIEFTDIPITTTSTAVPVTVKNNGSGSITLTGMLTGAAYSGAMPNGATIGPGSAASYNVQCTPTLVQSYPGRVDFVANPGGYMGSTTLACNGITSSIGVNPTAVTFDPTLVGRPPANKMITITGTNTTVLEMVQLDATATAAGVTISGTNPQGMTIGTGKTVTLAYGAAAVHESGPLGTLIIKASTDTVARNIGISGEALLGGLGTNPAAVDFGVVCVGDSATENVEVYASEPGNIVLQQLTAPSAPFGAMVLGQNLPRPLAGNHTGASVSIATSVTPTAPGDITASLVLTSDVPNASMTSLELRASVLANGVGASPDTVNFGAVMPEATSSIKTVQLGNCGTTDLMFQSAQIAGTHAGEFTLIGANPARTLAPGETETFMLVMQPASNGPKSAQLLLNHSAGTTTVDLDGTGDGGETTDRETYYACSTGRPAAWWPILLALLALRRRRR